ncbi:MAG: hypothetical protein NT018_04155 [Armatimonadetes bacterium]|nr:hypothetical protein [Armatimonadota bacterium]
MKNDRLREDNDNIQNLDDIIDAHDERKLYAPDEIDALEEDVEIGEVVDVDEALTFPHPKRHVTADVELMSTRRKKDMDEPWRMADRDMLPTDYEEHYSDAVDTYATDNMDEIVEEHVHELGMVTQEMVGDEPALEVMPNKFTPDEETG